MTARQTALVAFAVLGTALVLAAAALWPAAGTRCEEDMSCWNCQTMGNHVCGTGPVDPLAP